MSANQLNLSPLVTIWPAGLTPPTWPDIVLCSAYLTVFAILLWQRSRQTAALKPVFSLLAAFSLSCVFTHTVSVLPVKDVPSDGWAVARFVAAALTGAIVIVLLRLLPRATESERDARKEDLARLRLLAAAVNASGDGVMIAELSPDEDSQLSIVYANPAFERLTGYSTAEAVGCSPSILPDDENGPAALESVRAALRGTEPVRMEIPNRRKDGGRLWIEWQVVPVSDESSGHSHSVAVLRDTTERRSAEQAMRESEERFRSLFEHAADAIFVLESGGKIVDVNRRACHILGYSREELLKMRLADLDTGSRVGHLVPADTMTQESWYRHKDGTRFPVEVRFALMEAGRGKLKLGLVRDIARRRQVEQTLRDREELLRNVISHIPCGIFWKDRNSVYMGCNEQVARDAGLRGPEEVVGKTDHQLGWTKEEASLYQENDQKVMRTGEPLMDTEETLTRANGERIVLSTSKVPLRDSAGSVVGVLGVYQNITERKRLEEQFRQAQKMDAVGRLAGGIAHDFNNLLTVIRGNTDLLRPAVGAGSCGSSLLDEVSVAADRAAGLVRQLLTFSRRQPVRMEVIDLNAVVAGLVEMLRRLLGERIVIETRLALHPVTTRADYRHMEQVVMNLAVNARDAMPDGGTLTLGTSVVEGNSPDNRLARLWVRDTGVGMTDEVKARIFEPFYTTKGPDKGSGIGLATVFGIVEQASGRVYVESRVAAGSTFYVDMPHCNALPTAATSTPIPVALPEKKTTFGKSVLLVEDEDSVRKFARLTLEGHGFKVTDAPDGDTAIRDFDHSSQYQLLVTDLTMPGIDGRDLARRIRTTLPEIAVIVMSGYVPDNGRLEGVPGVVFLPKPFTPTDLLRAAGKAISRPLGAVCAAEHEEVHAC